MSLIKQKKQLILVPMLLLAVCVTAQVGIGTSTPTSPLDIETSTSTTDIDINNTAADGDPSVNFQLSGTTTFTIGVNDGEADEFRIGTSDLEDTQTRFGIDASGNVAIGTVVYTALFNVDGSAIFNESGADKDFRIEGDTEENLLFIDGSADKVGIGTATPDQLLEVYGGYIKCTDDAGEVILTHSGNIEICRAVSAPINTASFIDFKSLIATDYDCRMRQNEVDGLAFDVGGWGSLIYDVLVLAPDGNVGIGIATPGAKLDVRGSAIFNEDGDAVDFRVEGDTEANLLFVDASADNVGIGTATPGAKLDVRGSAIFNESGDAVDFRVEGDTEANLLFVDASTDRVGIGTSSPSVPLEVYGGNLKVTNGTAVVELSSVGRIEIAHPTGVGGVDFKSSTAEDYDCRIVQISDGLKFETGGDGSQGTAMILNSSQALQLSGYGAGTLVTDASGNVTASSDERLKNIQGDFTRGLTAIKNIQPITYKWKSSTGNDSIYDYSGFSAQNVQASIPEAIGVDPRGFLTISDRPIIAALVNAVNEQQAIIEAQKQEIETIKAEASSKTTETDKKLAALEAKLNALLLLISQGTVLTTEK